MSVVAGRSRPEDIGPGLPAVISRQEFPGGVEARHKFLHSLNRHCDANSGRCVHKACLEFTGYSLAGNGTRIEPLVTRKICKKHKPLFFESSGWEVLTSRTLTGRHDEEGNLLPGQVNKWDAINARAEFRRDNAAELAAATARAAVTTPAPPRMADAATSMRSSG